MHVSKRMFADFEAYWRRLQETVSAAGDGAFRVPTRKQFNPMAVPKLLPNLFMMEYASEDELFIRLTGTAIDIALERPMTGVNILDLYKGDERAFFKSAHENMARQPCAAVLRRFVRLSNDKGYELTSKSFPLADDAGHIKYVVGMMGADLMHLSPLGEEAVLTTSTIIDFFYVDLGRGVPDEGYDWVKALQAS